jgi:hypothetical protein
MLSVALFVRGNDELRSAVLIPEEGKHLCLQRHAVKDYRKTKKQVCENVATCCQ